eukprot:1149052-Pelagomonas_calceolata.AAC.2
MIKHKDDDFPPLSGSGVYKPGRDTAPHSQHLQLHINPNGQGPTNAINKAELAGNLVALQQGQNDVASDNAFCLSQISKQTLNPMRMRNHLHAELIHAISNMLEHSPHPIHFFKVRAHSGIIGNEGADACARSAALTYTTDITLPDARDPFHNFYWLSLETSHGHTDSLHLSHGSPIHYLTNLNDKLRLHMHKNHKLGSADTSSYHSNSWQRVNYAIKPNSPVTTANIEAHKPNCQLANKEVINYFWYNPKITLKEQINVIKYCTGTIYTQKHAIRFNSFFH